MAMKTCCFGCNEITYVDRSRHIDRFFATNNTFAMPVQSSDKSKKFLGHDYIHMLSIRSAGLFAPAVKPDPIEMGKSLMTSILNTWPMLIIVLVLSVAAGFCVWVLVSTPN